MGAKEHDQAVALTSHLPQIISSLLAIQLAQGSPSTLDLAGAGLRDTTRIAASSPALWQEIIVANSAALKPLLAKTIADLSDILENIENEVAVGNFIEAGNRGRNLIPGKHGGVARNYTFLPVVIEDRAGELARLFDACALAQVNVEDLSIEHSPEQLTGLITLALSENDARILHQHLLDNGWRVHLPRQ
jgi:prephenate dehydrogenase